MNKMTISGAEYRLMKIFSDEFVFTIPLYQRPYAWTTEQSEELLQDLLRAMQGNEETIEELPPYFLGSIVLIKGEEADAQVIDGQQRLTTLTMLISALRSLIKSEYANELTNYLCQKENIITRTPKRYRLRLRERDTKFFQQYIQNEGGIEELKTLTDIQLPESQRNIRDNTLSFIRELQKLSEHQLIALTQFIFQRCFLVVVSVSTPDLDSVYRIFSVLNSRGLDLSYPDILKTEIIGTIPREQQEDYATRWEELENLLGREEFEALFFDLRSIFARKRIQKGMIEEFKEYVYSGHSQTLQASEFIDTILSPYAHALNNILKANYALQQRPEINEEINTMFKWLNQLDHHNWMPPALCYFRQYHLKAPRQVIHFLEDLERLVVSFVLCRTPPYRRVDRYCDILHAIHQQEDLFSPHSPLQLTPRERLDMIRALDGNIYQFYHICKYVLLRLNTILADKGMSLPTYNYAAISIEHVLPRNPAYDSDWMKAFPTREKRDKYVHRLANLVLLSKGKNMKAENFDFKKKKEKYFDTTGDTPQFAITAQVINLPEWTPAILEGRQKQLMERLKQLWEL